MLQVFNPWKVNQVVPHIITTCKYYELSFIGDQNPMVIPYHSPLFWTQSGGSGAIRDQFNGSITKYQQLNAMSWGVEWIKGEIQIEVFAVTRQRLIQTGSTNYLTYDFETGQNLFFATADRQAEAYEITQYAANCNQIGNIRTNQTSLFSSAEDNYTKEEIPMKFRKTYTVHFPKLTHENIHMPTDITNSNNYRFLIPGAQGTSLVGQGATAQNYLNHQNLIQQTNANTGNVSRVRIDNMQPQVCYPRIHLAQPQVADETGFMKFRFPVRITTRLYLNMHLIPDFNPSGTSYSNFQLRTRQVLHLPSVVNESTTSTQTNFYVYCMPYRFKC